MLNLRCRLLQYAVFVGMATKQSSKNFFDLFCFHAMASRFLSSSEDEIRQLLEKKDSKNKKNIQSRSASVSGILVGKGGFRADRKR